MSTIVVVLDKYSDWLEAYSAIVDYSSDKVNIHFVEDDRNDFISVSTVMNELVPDDRTVNVIPHFTKANLFDTIREVTKDLTEGDVLVAPFIRYRDLWDLVTKTVKGVTTVHISECLPDTFGHIGYRLGFRGNKLKTWLTLPLAKIYAMSHKPDVCYFPLAPSITNPFVKKTKPIVTPPLLPAKKKVLERLFGGIKRSLLIGGFGYDVRKMATALGITHYVATSKGIEIIVDGVVHPLAERICAEEVLLSGWVSRLVSYNSSAVVWARLLDSKMPIDCYEAEIFKQKYGPFFNGYANNTLKIFGIKVKPQNELMIS